MKRGRTRSKPCSRCGAECRALFRARVAADGAWVFLCESCLLAAKKDNPHYCYGGTRKARKRQ